MSLLPEFNTHIYPKIFEGTCSESAGRRGLIMHAVDKLKDLLNPDLNPLTFQEVKAWFDWKVTEGRGEIIYGDTHAHESYGNVYYLYHIHEANYYHSRYIASDGFKYSLNSSEKHGFYELIESDKAHYSLCELLNLTPLELFCQMKGYVNI